MKAFFNRNRWLIGFAILGAVYALGVLCGAGPLASASVFAVPFLMGTAGAQVGPDSKNASGTTLWGSSSYGSFFGATPVVQPSGSTQAALATNADLERWFFHFDNTEFANGDMITTFTPGFAGTLVGLESYAKTPATTASKASTLNLEIGTTDTTGGVLAMTTTTLGTKGKVTSSTAITGASTFSNTDTISLEASSTTAFIEGTTEIAILFRRTSTSDLLTAIRTALVNLGLMKGSA